MTTSLTSTPNSTQTLHSVESRHALHEAAWYALPLDAGVIALGDADRVDFLQRMTTNNIATLRTRDEAQGESTVTILTSPTARIVQVFTVLARGDLLWLLPSPGEGAALARHLRGQIFFLDKVKVQDIGDAWRRVRVVGPRATEILLSAGIQAPAADNRWTEHEGIVAVAQQHYGIPGVELLVPAPEFDAVAGRLVQAGAPEITTPTLLEGIRVALGRPAPGSELTGDYTPLEVEMEWACSENKGCYTGQEIIARQRTYDKVTRTLVGIQSDSLLTAGDSLLHDGREVGKVTSVALHPESGAPIALAVVKRPANTPGTLLTANNAHAEVVAPSFANAMHN